MGELIDMASASRVKRHNHLRGLSDHEREYAYKLLSIFRQGQSKRKALEECIDVLYEYINDEPAQESKKQD